MMIREMNLSYNRELWAIAGVVGITEYDIDTPIFCSLAKKLDIEP